MAFHPMYVMIKVLFKLLSNIFYSSFDVRGKENVPPPGQATILCFNHSNSLTDSIVLISKVPRTIRFCAKNTLWSIPVVGSLIRGSGAVPVFRRSEHGDKATEFNEGTFRAVYGALDGGDCVGFSPEGVSSFRSYATKFKSGVAHIALETVQRAIDRGEPDFEVKILPAVMAWTHREKFRSDVMLRFRPPVVVTKAWLDPQRFASRKDAADALIKIVEDEFLENMISAPDWATIRLAITATRIQRPLGTFMSLSSYMYYLRGWVEVFKGSRDAVVPPDEDGKNGKGDEGDEGDEGTSGSTGSNGSTGNTGSRRTRTMGELADVLSSYQDLLNAARVKDERVRRIGMAKGKRPSSARCARIIAFRVALCLVLGLVALPGLLVWSPVWFAIKWKERALLKKGAGWVDSVAENKMMVGFFGTIIIALVFNVFTPLLLPYMLLVMRLYEEAVASARSAMGNFRLMRMDQRKLDKLLDARHKAQVTVLASARLFPKSSAERILTECDDDIYEDKTHEEVRRPRWWHNFSPKRRRKKDWNELLRLEDYCTMDYT